MVDEIIFQEDARRDLMSAAVRLYEAKMYDHCMMILNILMSTGASEAYVLAGHCMSEMHFVEGEEISNVYYKSACSLGSAVGCYNLFLNFNKKDNDLAESYLLKAKNLGWES